MELAEINEVVNELNRENKFKQWKEQHPDSFLSYFFCSLDSSGRAKSNWEMGLFNPENEMITVFVIYEGKIMTINNEDEVLNKENVEELDLNKAKIPFKKAGEIFSQKLKELFPDMKTGDGFVVLQTINKKTLWNFTVVNKALQFVNIKINALSGKIDSHQVVELVQKPGAA